MAKVRAESNAITSPFRKSNDNDNVSGKFRDRSVSKEKAKAPVIKTNSATPKPIVDRVIAFFKPKFIRRLEVSSVFKAADKHLSGLIQDVNSGHAQSARSKAADLISTLIPLLRGKEDTPEIADLLGLRMDKLIRTMTKQNEDLEALYAKLESILQTPNVDADLYNVAGLLAFAIKATSLDQQFKAIEKRGNTAFVRETPRPFEELKEKDLRELSDMQDTANDLVEVTENYDNGGKALPGTQVSRNRLLHIQFFAVQAEKELKYFGSSSP